MKSWLVPLEESKRRRQLSACISSAIAHIRNCTNYFNLAVCLFLLLITTISLSLSVSLSSRNTKQCVKSIDLFFLGSKPYEIEWCEILRILASKSEIRLHSQIVCSTLCALLLMFARLLMDNPCIALITAMLLNTCENIIVSALVFVHVWSKQWTWMWYTKWNWISSFMHTATHSQQKRKWVLSQSVFSLWNFLCFDSRNKMYFV